MSAEQLFSLANLLAMLGWILLAVLPGHARVTGLVTARLVPGLFAIAYVILIATQFGRTDGGFSSLAGVAALFANPWMLLAGWIHYLAFDLLIGTWEARDSVARGVPRWLLVPCLFLTFMFGPAGWLAYVIVSQRYPGRTA